jgi:hypothetical protein
MSGSLVKRSVAALTSITLLVALMAVSASSAAAAPMGYTGLLGGTFNGGLGWDKAAICPGAAAGLISVEVQTPIVRT